MKQFTENGKIGFKDCWERVVMEPQFDAVDRFLDPEGGCSSGTREWGVLKDGKWGMVDSVTERWITPCTWESVGRFRYGLAKVKWCGKWGFINRNGMVVTHCQWDEIESFTNKKTAARAWQNGKVNYILINGEVLFDMNSPFTDLRFDAVDTFYDPEYLWCEYGEFHKGGHPGSGCEVAVKMNGKWGLIHRRKNRWITPCQWDAVGYLKYGFAKVKRNGQWGFIDTEGNLTVPCRWDAVESFTWQGTAKVKLNGKFGYVDREGNEPVKCEWQAVGSYDSQWMLVKREGRWFLRSGEGKLHSSGDRKEKLVFHQGLAVVHDGFGYGLVDRDGWEIIACEWDAMERAAQNAGGYPWKRNPFIHLWENRSEYPYKLIKVRKNRKWGLYDLNGKECHPCTLDKVWRFQNGVAKICEDDKWGLIDENGRIITPCQWEYVDYFREGKAAVRLNKHWGAIDREGNLIHPCTHYVGLWGNE